jgi:hypothetical protein
MGILFLLDFLEGPPIGDSGQITAGSSYFSARLSSDDRNLQQNAAPFKKLLEISPSIWIIRLLFLQWK